MPEVFNFITPHSLEAPILISSPHSGIAFPEDEKGLYEPEHIEKPSDTDWFIDDLYSFASELGLPLIHANFSRYVIDLNRPLDGRSLYEDKRSETGLFPTSTFSGKRLYLEEIPTELKKKRIETFYKPYYQKISRTLNEMEKKFGCALLIDGHSIKSVVPSIRNERFPHFIVGTADEQSCPAKVQDAFVNSLKENSQFKVTLNTPFKGGNITRCFGKKDSNTWSMQLEMTQDLYLNEETGERLSDKFTLLQTILKNAVHSVKETILAGL